MQPHLQGFSSRAGTQLRTICSLPQTQTDLAPGHVSLINVYEAILTPQHLGLVMEWAAGGSLTSRIADRFPQSQPGSLIMGEDEARFYFTQYVDAVDYCHKHDIAHRSAYAHFHALLACCMLSQPSISWCAMAAWHPAASMSRPLHRALSRPTACSLLPSSFDVVQPEGTI